MDDDVGLLDAWAKGDTDAGIALFERNFAAIARFFRNKVDGPIDDLVQQTFLGCLEGRARVRGDAGFRGYLFGVARNVLGKHYRGRAVDRDSAPLEGDDDPVLARSVCELGGAATSAYADDRRAQRMLTALRRIPLGAQLVLELVYWESMTAAEVAAALDVPVGTAKTRIRSARLLLGQRLAELEDGRVHWKTTATGFDTWARGARAARGGVPVDSA
jgi:RNA polymerase sigma-70 factor (ECF subfamily)